MATWNLSVSIHALCRKTTNISSASISAKLIVTPHFLIDSVWSQNERLALSHLIASFQFLSYDFLSELLSSGQRAACQHNVPSSEQGSAGSFGPTDLQRSFCQ
jgi:hypothetical protein